MGVIISDRICKDCIVELCNWKLAVDMLILDTKGYDVILGMTWLSGYYAVIDCRNKKIIFQILHQLEFKFEREHTFAKRKTQLARATAEVKKKGILIWNEFPDIFKNLRTSTRQSS